MGTRHLSGKEKKQLKELIPKGYEIDKKDEIIEENSILFKNKNPYLIKIENLYLPHLKSLNKDQNEIKSVFIDHGAIPFLLKGADMMRPGIQKIEEGFEKDEIIIVKDEIKNIPLGIGISLFSSKDMKSQEKGKSVKILHYFKDEFY